MAVVAGMLSFNANGRVQCTLTAPVDFGSGTPIGPAGRLAVATVGGAIALLLAGIPLTANRRICVTLGGVPAFFSQSYAFDAAGRVLFDTSAPIAFYVAGIPRTASGAVAAGPSINP